MPMRLDRRALLRSSAACSTLALSGLRLPVLKTKHVILVAFAGGVRTKETLGTPRNVPNLVRMAEQGVAYPRAKTSNLGHFGATMSLLTGVSEARGIRDNTRGSDPTLFEYVRKDLELGPDRVWMSTSGGVQQANYSYSLHRDYGEAYGANTVDGDGIFNAEFRSIVSAYGRPRVLGERESDLLAAMRRAIQGAGPESVLNNAESSARIERFLLKELTSGTSELRGTGAADAKAFRIARNLLAAFRPTLLCVTLQDADIAHRSYNGYVEVIRRNDEMLGELWRAVQAQPDLADSTAIFVVPEFGRDADLNSRRGLDHGDGSDDMEFVSAVCWGPDFHRGSEVLSEVRAIDVCATICHLLGANPRHAHGRVLPKLLG